MPKEMAPNLAASNTTLPSPEPSSQKDLSFLTPALIRAFLRLGFLVGTYGASDPANQDRLSKQSIRIIIVIIVITIPPRLVLKEIALTVLDYQQK